MSTRFDTLVAERLEISEERARKLLRAMLKEVRDRAAEEEVRFPELGTFREEEGTLTFSPSPSLRRLVNQEYEGLPPESAPPPRRAEPTDESEEDLPPAQPEPTEEPPSPPASEDEPEQAPGPSPWEPGAQGAAEEAEYPIVEEDLGDDTDTAAEADEKSPYDAPNEARDDDAEDEVEDEVEDEPERERTAAMSTADSFQLVVGILLVVFLVVVGWFVLTQTGVLSSSTGPSSQASGPGTDSVMARTETSPDADEDPGSEQPARFRGTTPGPANARDAITPAGTGWTIVVASVPSRATAEDLRREYETQFSTVEIHSATVEGAVRYRVVIGQYSSREAVVQALDQHATQLPDGAWVLER